MPAIVLQFAAGTGLPSHLIEWFGHGQWSHVDIVLPDGEGLLGARQDGGVRIRAAAYLAPGIATRRVALDTTDEVASRYIALARAELGKPYDMAAILAFAAGRNWRRPDSWFCSELAGRLLEPDKSGFLKFCLATAANRLTPADLWLVCGSYADLGS